MRGEHFLSPKILAELLPSRPRRNVVLVLLTVGEDGYPNVCLLSPYQVVASSNHTVFFAVYSGTRTQVNLSERGKATFVIILPPTAYYVKGRAEPVASKGIAPLRGNIAYRFEVTRASRDYYRRARITSTITFDQSHVLQDYSRVYQGLVKLVRLRSRLNSSST